MKVVAALLRNDCADDEVLPSLAEAEARKCASDS